MDLSQEQTRREEFRKILFDLATTQDYLKDDKTRSSMYERLENLYYSPQKEKQFRHFYSDIFWVLSKIKQEPTRGSIDVLGQNLIKLRNSYTPKRHDESGNKIDISDSMQKLYDHVSLDIARIQYSEEGDRTTSGEKTISEIQSKLTQLDNAVNNTIQAQKDAETELNKQQKEYIAILGIFAAVVLTFTGGIAFSTSVLENIASVSPYRILIVALIIGLVLINVLFGLFYYIDLLVNGHEKRTLKPLWISNIVIVGLIFLVIIAWAFGVVECRNRNISTQSQEISVVQEIQDN